MGPTLSALDQGFEVYVITDACGDVSPESHERAVERMVQAGVRPMTSLQYLLELQRDWARSRPTARPSASPRASAAATASASITPGGCSADTRAIEPTPSATTHQELCMTNDPIKILVEHEDILLQAGLAALLTRFTDLVLAHDVDGTVDVVVTDYNAGLRHVRQNAAVGAGPRVVVLTRRDSELDIRCALSHGVDGYMIVGCSVDSVVDAIRAVRQGLRHLDPVATHRLAESMFHEPLTGRERNPAAGGHRLREQGDRRAPADRRGHREDAHAFRAGQAGCREPDGSRRRGAPSRSAARSAGRRRLSPGRSSEGAALTGTGRIRVQPGHGIALRPVVRTACMAGFLPRLPVAGARPMHGDRRAMGWPAGIPRLSSPPATTPRRPSARRRAPAPQ